MAFRYKCVMSALRFQSFRLRNGKIARNRVVVPPMASGTANENGQATPASIAHYRRLAGAGAGIVFAEYSYVHLSGKSEPNQLGAADNAHLLGLRAIACAIQAAGALAGLQIVHAGGKSDPTLTGGALLGASGVAVPVKCQALEQAREIAPEEITKMQEWYFAAATLAAKAGFDLVELHAAHGYGLNQWLSPLTNQRMDIYGGDVAGRSRMLLEIAARIRTRLPELLLAVRLPAQDHLPGGLRIADMGRVVAELEELGADLIDVSSGIGGWRRPEGREGQGYLVADSAAIKRFTALPVIGVGGIETGAFIDESLERDRLDFAAVGRAILKDPLAWGERELRCGAEALALCYS